MSEYQTALRYAKGLREEVQRHYAEGLIAYWTGKKLYPGVVPDPDIADEIRARLSEYGVHIR